MEPSDSAASAAVGGASPNSLRYKSFFSPAAQQPEASARVNDNSDNFLLSPPPIALPQPRAVVNSSNIIIINSASQRPLFGITRNVESDEFSGATPQKLFFNESYDGISRQRSAEHGAGVSSPPPPASTSAAAEGTIEVEEEPIRTPLRSDPSLRKFTSTPRAQPLSVKDVEISLNESGSGVFGVHSGAEDDEEDEEFDQEFEESRPVNTGRRSTNSSPMNGHEDIPMRVIKSGTIKDGIQILPSMRYSSTQDFSEGSSPSSFAHPHLVLLREDSLFVRVFIALASLVSVCVGIWMWSLSARSWPCILSTSLCPVVMFVCWVCSALCHNHRMILPVFGVTLMGIPWGFASSSPSMLLMTTSLMCSLIGLKITVYGILQNGPINQRLAFWKREWECGRNRLPFRIPGGNFTCPPCTFDSAMLVVYLGAGITGALVSTIPLIVVYDYVVANPIRAVSTPIFSYFLNGLKSSQIAGFVIFCLTILLEIIACIISNRGINLRWIFRPPCHILTICAYLSLALFVAPITQQTSIKNIWTILVGWTAIIATLIHASASPFLWVRMTSINTLQPAERKVPESLENETFVGKFKRRGFIGSVLRAVDIWLEVQHELYLERREQRNRQKRYMQKFSRKSQKSDSGSGFRRRRAQLKRH